MIRYAFDHHICTVCRDAKRAHRIEQITVSGSAKPEFLLRCSTCGDEDGPYAGEPTRALLNPTPTEER